MTKLATILAIALVATTAACNLDDTDQSETEIIKIFEMPQPGVDGRAVPSDSPREWSEMADPGRELGAEVCECTTIECQQDWVKSNFGCGVCVLATCDNGEGKGACVSCDDEQQTTPVNPVPFDPRARINNELNEAI